MKQWIALLALGFAGIALAQDSAPPFEEVDTNQDGQVSRTEAAAIEGLEFTTADTNQDGSLDRTEYMAAASRQGQGGAGQQPGQ
jgi:hypothetical protein